MTRYAIVGSRRRTDRQSVIDRVMALPGDSVVVSGGAKGPDKWAEQAAMERGLHLVVHLPERGPAKSRWEATERFYARNQRLVDDADVVIAFVSADRKGGTEDTIRRAEKKGIPVILA
jgi:hypothetical protein